ncbi:uncharacterized protein [Miscanthus floridulus]|uniref:uncharacterized protein n=1 Tax=Miscanthus floridulus TaxID=154761 RepID=UPI003457E1FF
MLNTLTVVAIIKIPLRTLLKMLRRCQMLPFLHRSLQIPLLHLLSSGSHHRDASGKAANPSSRKRLTFSDETPDQLPDKDSEEKGTPTAEVDDNTTVAAQNSDAVGKDATPEKKRSRGEQPLVQESG